MDRGVLPDPFGAGCAGRFLRLFVERDGFVDGHTSAKCICLEEADDGYVAPGEGGLQRELHGCDHMGVRLGCFARVPTGCAMKCALWVGPDGGEDAEHDLP